MIFGAFDKDLTKTRIQSLGLKSVTLPTYRHIYPDLTGRVKRAQQLQSWGVQVVGHPCIYALDPSWPESSESESALRDYALHYYNTFRDTLRVIDVVNEPFHHPVMGSCEYIYLYACAGRINEYGILTGEITDMFVSQLRGKTWYTRIGVQAHVQGGVGYDLIWGTFTEKFMRGQLEKLRALEVPVDISEISIPSAGNGWTETRQRDFFLRLYDACYGLVESMSWWEIKDSPGMWNANTGMLTRLGKEKKIVAAWRSLAKR